MALIGGPDFGILGEGYIRLSYANSEENILRARADRGVGIGATTNFARSCCDAKLQAHAPSSPSRN